MSHILAADQPLSQSLLWEIQRHFFRTQGIAAWQQDIVPHYISSNPVLARAYAQIVLGYWRDCLAAQRAGTRQLDWEAPLTIIELGAGNGRFAHHFLFQLEQIWSPSPLPTPPIRYIMTDFAPALLAAWQKNERLQRWVQAGQLDFALFDAAAPAPLTLVHSGQTIHPNQESACGATCKGKASLTPTKNLYFPIRKPTNKPTTPLILIANYFFDSIPQDSFIISDGGIQPNLLTLLSRQPEPDYGDPTLWERLELAYEAVPLPPPYYETAVYDAILADYAAHFPPTTITFPNIGLDCLRFWEGTGSPLLLLSSDRGYTLPDSLLGQGNPLLNLHGSFSMMVNYHAITEYVTRRGGRALTTPHYQDNLQIVAGLLGEPPAQGEETALAFQQAVAQGGPDDFFALKQVVETHYDQMSLAQLLSWLRLTQWDAAVFLDCLPALEERIKTADPVWYPDVALALQAIQAQYLPLGEENEVKTAVARLSNLMNSRGQAIGPDL